MSNELIDVMLLGFAATHAAPLLAPIVYVRSERQYRVTWQQRTLPPYEHATSAYRSGGPLPSGHLPRAPRIVRLAALSSLVLGAAFLPGLLWGLIGVLAWGLGFLSLPGLIIAASLWRTGLDLLRGHPEGAARAESTAKYAIYLNVIIVVGAGVAAAVASNTDLTALALFTGAYALLSIGQALLVRRAARVLGDVRTTSDSTPSPSLAEPHPAR